MRQSPGRHHGHPCHPFALGASGCGTGGGSWSTARWCNSDGLAAERPWVLPIEVAVADRVLPAERGEAAASPQPGAVDGRIGPTLNQNLSCLTRRPTSPVALAISLYASVSSALSAIRLDSLFTIWCASCAITRARIGLSSVDWHLAALVLKIPRTQPTKACERARPSRLPGELPSHAEAPLRLFCGMHLAQIEGHHMRSSSSRRTCVGFPCACDSWPK